MQSEYSVPVKQNTSVFLIVSIINRCVKFLRDFYFCINLYCIASLKSTKIKMNMAHALLSSGFLLSTIAIKM